LRLFSINICSENVFTNISYTNKYFDLDSDAALQGLTGYIHCVIPTWPLGTPIGSFLMGGEFGIGISSRE
jgi:hypothetical protein